MWQRIQTLYLAVTILLQWGSFCVPLGGFTDAERAGQCFYLTDVAKVESFILSVLVTIGAVWAICNFKNRKSQMQLCTLLTIATTVTLLSTVVNTWFFATDQSVMPNLYYVYLTLPIVAIAMVVLAKRAIHKDDELVRSSNRLR